MPKLTLEELKFLVVYSMRLEKMMETLLGRVDKLGSFLQILLGVSVVTSFAPVATGLLVAVVAAAQLVWQPGVKSSEARSSFCRWQALYHQCDDMEENEFRRQVKDISDHDGFVLSSLQGAAQLAAAVQMNCVTDTIPSQSRSARVLAFFAGA